MVCDRCIRVVKDELQNIGLKVSHVELGEVEINSDVNDPPEDLIRSTLIQNGFELIEDKKARLIETIKNIVIRLIQKDADYDPQKTNYSKYISDELHMDYNYLSGLFSSVANITIEQFIILQKIERAKEFLKYDENNLSEIAYKLGYSSVQHLSAQFKNVTGLTASQFKNMTANLRKPLDKVV
ncbi:MAG: AraC family transcriptional regulator [Calditrichaeota bacterium]|nr:MAG: AraC family transcriptional regulator [Calditrichota bacterium]MBL1207213.1 AraC family transcriptional regulator [Calditrichota bacterium]NOG47046.1 helix-turn-helix transcriptional regulator [Calditrichota bacterium]